MPSKLSTDLMALPDVFFGGASQKSYMSPWDHSLWINDDVTDRTRFSFGWIQPGTGTHVTMSADFAKTIPGRNEVVRFICHYILDQVPDEGLDELGETLAHLFEFYAERAQFERPQLTHEVGTASIGKSYDRDSLYITEE